LTFLIFAFLFPSTLTLAQSSEIFHNFPQSLQSFLTSCRSLSFNRTCSLDPLFSYPPQSPSEPRRRQTPPPAAEAPVHSHLKGKAKAHHTNALKAGQSPKKHHEVVKFCALVESMMEEESCGYCVDVGSGRVSTLPPLPLLPKADLVVPATGSPFTSPRFSTSQPTRSRGRLGTVTEDWRRETR
jgi:hypothetical protein